MKLSTLKKKAQKATNFRGHRMRWASPFALRTGMANPPCGQTARCIYCGKYVQILENVDPNQIDIGGNALALTCQDK